MLFDIKMKKGPEGITETQQVASAHQTAGAAFLHLSYQERRRIW